MPLPLAIAFRLSRVRFVLLFVVGGRAGAGFQTFFAKKSGLFIGGMFSHVEVL
jgi:hypothetical protein